MLKILGRRPPKNSLADFQKVMIFLRFFNVFRILRVPDAILTSRWFQRPQNDAKMVPRWPPRCSSWRLLGAMLAQCGGLGCYLGPKMGNLEPKMGNLACFLVYLGEFCWILDAKGQIPKNNEKPTVLVGF